MAVLKVNPTRVNLLKLKKQVKTARRGHKLLKDKRDGLMKKFMEIIREARKLRKEAETKIGEAFRLFLLASSTMPKRSIENALLMPTTKIHLDVKTKNVMSVHIPEFEAEFSGTALTYSSVGTSGNLDIALLKFQEIFPLLLRLAAVEKSAEALADEIEKTRRRVNALEYTMIPNLVQTIKYIVMKLEEQARDALVGVMRIKSMIEEKEKAVKRLRAAA
jgi:V/A-type H+-transporting ATPase subunit D